MFRPAGFTPEAVARFTIRGATPQAQCYLPALFEAADFVSSLAATDVAVRAGAKIHIPHSGISMVL